MAGNNFNIPTFDIDLLNWSNNVKAQNAARARERQQDWNRVYDTAAALGKQIRAEEEAEKARQEAAQQAALQREFQAQEAEKARAFQAAQNAENRRVQQEYNAGLKAQEEAKLKAKQFDAAQTEYATLLGKETPTGGELMRMNQLRQNFPELDKYNTGKIDDQGMPIYGSLYDDSIAQRNAARDEALRYAKFKNSMPTTFKNAKEKEYWQNEIEKQGFDSGRTAELYNYIGGNKDLKTKVKESVQGAIAGNAGNVQTQKLENAQAEQAVTNKINSGSMLTGDERALAIKLGYHWDKQSKKWVK